MRWSKFTAFVVLTLVLGACEKDSGIVDGGDGGNGGDDGLEPTLASIQSNIFNLSCALSGCHTGSNAPEGLDLSAGNARGNLVSIESTEVPDFLRVDPGNADESYLIMKLEGDSRISGSRMPLGRSPLSSSQIAVIRTWIDEGAN